MLQRLESRCTRPSFEFLSPGDFGVRGLNTETSKGEVEANAVKERQPPQCHMSRTLRRVVKIWHFILSSHLSRSLRMQVYIQPPYLHSEFNDKCLRTYVMAILALRRIMSFCAIFQRTS